MAELTVVDTQTIPWESGLDVIAGMVPAFRDNLGPAAELEAAYRLYRQKRLWSDPVTTRRIDLIHLDAGYADLTDAYHDSVEECFVLDGDCTLKGEGELAGHYYFWRPPGWIHSASTRGGFDALLSLEGRSAGDASGPTSRNIRPSEAAGTNALHADMDSAIGPRGWVRCVDTRLIAWQSGHDFARSENGNLDGLDVANLKVKVLSKNPTTGAQSLLMRLYPGFAEAGPATCTAAQQFFVVEGAVQVGEYRIGQGGFVHWPAGVVAGPVTSAEGALLFLKSDGWIDRSSVRG